MNINTLNHSRLSSKNISSNRKGFSRLFGLFVIWVGLVFLGRGAEMFYIYFASANWPVVKAQVISAEVHIERSHDSATTGAIGTFTYEYQSQKYSSAHLDIAGGSNTNVADKEKKVAYLLEAKNTNQTVDAYVNPKDPSYAIIFREISQNMVWNLILGICLTPIGYKMSKSLFFSKTKKKQYPETNS